MSDPAARDYSFTVRLSAAERAELEALASQWGVDKSATVRRALQRAFSTRQRLPQHGHFVALQPEAVSFSVRLSGKAAHER
ncbi:MAG: hypothetical protein SNJ54_16125 [Anaerolineae bacterium]